LLTVCKSRLGSVYEEVGQLTEAVEQYRGTVKLDPTHQFAKDRLEKIQDKADEGEGKAGE
jgi:hypothetical protein